ncbi:MAG TPA: inorganic diphosphatase [Bryobacteraceae bacterium]|nr:inorganic diphosphatase [Bryobacteraceae bacterium]
MQFHFEPDPGNDFPVIVRMIVEIRKDSSNKYEYDPSLGLFRLSRALYSPMHYPGDYGFIPGTIAEDGEPLDVLSLVTTPSFSGCMMDVRPVAVLDMLDGQDVDHKILALPNGDPRYESITELDHLGQHVQREIEHFFEIYKDLEGHPMQTRGWRAKTETHTVIVESRHRYLNKSRSSDCVSA